MMGIRFPWGRNAGAAGAIESIYLKQIFAVCQCWLLASIGIMTRSISGLQKNPQTQAHFVKHLLSRFTQKMHKMMVNT